MASEPPGGDTSFKGKSLVDRVAIAGRWAISILAAAGTFAIGNFAFNELGNRPVEVPERLGLFAWPGGDGWAFVGVASFALGIALIAATVIWVINSARVSLSYLTSGPAMWFTIKRRVRKATSSSSYFLQVPRPNRTAIERFVNSYVDAMPSNPDNEVPPAAAAAAQRLHNELELVMAPQAAPETIANIAAAAAAVIGDRTEHLYADDLKDANKRDSIIVRLADAFSEEHLRTWIADHLWNMVVRQSEEEEEEERTQLSAAGVPAVHIHRLARSIAAVRHKVKLAIAEASSALTEDPADARGRAEAETKLREALRRHPFTLGEDPAKGSLQDDLLRTFSPELMKLRDFSDGYARAIRRGDEERAKHYREVTHSLLQTASNTRLQLTNRYAAAILPGLSVVAALGAALFLFTVNTANLMRNDQVTQADRNRNDALRAASEAVEGNIIATMPATAYLRIPASLSEHDPWYLEPEDCRVVKTEADGVALGSRALPAIVLELGAPPVDSENARIARRDDKPDNDAVLRVVTQPTTDCLESFEGWVPSAWITSIGPDDAGPSISDESDDSESSIVTTTTTTTGSPPSTTAPDETASVGDGGE